MNIYIERWNSDLGEAKYLSVTESGFLPVDECLTISGWYANYKEGQFVYWVEDDRQYIKWKNQKIELDTSSVIKWRSGYTGREFEVYRDQVLKLNVRYRSLFYRPWALITDIIVPGDDWGLEYDLPSYIHSHFLNGGLYEMLSSWNERFKS